MTTHIGLHLLRSYYTATRLSGFASEFYLQSHYLGARLNGLFENSYGTYVGTFAAAAGGFDFIF